MTYAIRVDQLSKSYRVSHTEQVGRYRTMRESMSHWLRRPLRRRTWQVPFWALQDISFEIRPGEVVGIIGRNGAGKSTLLKILSRITKPTSGRAEIYGRVGSLLEVGTGFHPELTGRENMYLNGSILGMSRREIDRHFDEIVAFAEVEEFLDTPVKRYSSGMYVRLAFAVAAHLEPEILVIDEVLAVGDVQFQNRCLTKMKSVATSGRTVILVSHQLSAVSRLCDSALLIGGGRLLKFGTTEDVIRQYTQSVRGAYSVGQWHELKTAARTGTGEIRCQAIRFAADRNRPDLTIQSGGRLEVDLALSADQPRRLTSAALTIYDLAGSRLINASSNALGQSFAIHAGVSHLAIDIRELHLSEGKYLLGVWLANGDRVYDYLTEAVRLDVHASRNESERFSRWDGPVACNYCIELQSQS